MNRFITRGLLVIYTTLLALHPVLSRDNTLQGVSAGDVPPPMPLVDKLGQHIVNVLLLGSDTSNPSNVGRTDVMMVISVNITASTVSFLSIPRDLYVYIPNWTMQRINTAYGHGENDSEDGDGVELLKQTIEYNLGLTIDHYARVDFIGFRDIVDALGGIDISVDCAIQDWKLRSPDLDPNLEENWELFTLPVGVHHMDGETALWYVRSRRTSSDFDRGRRQQDVLHAIWRRARGLGLVQQVPDLWGQLIEVVQTDLDTTDLLELLPIGTNLSPDRLAWYTFHPNQQVTFWRSPEGASVLLPVRDEIIELGRMLMIPPTEHQISREHQIVEVINTSGIQGLEQVASDRLSREGFFVQAGEGMSEYRESTVMIDYTGRSKGSSVAVLQRLLRLNDDNISVEPQADRTVDFRVYLGSSYYACTYDVLPPQTDGQS